MFKEYIDCHDFSDFFVKINKYLQKLCTNKNFLEIYYKKKDS